LTDCVVVDPSVSWNDVVNGFKGGMNNKSLKSALCRLSLGAPVYHLWNQRNDLLHGNPARSEEALVLQIKWQVRARLIAKGSVKMIGDKIGLVHFWNLQTLIQV